MKGSVKDSMKALVLLTLFISTSLTLDRVWAQFKVPALIGPVVDQAKVISYDDERNAETIIRKLYDSGQAQLVLVTLPSLEGQTIEQVGIQIADQWKLGTSERDNGILLIASVQDRAVRIEVGQGLEGTIPDATANRIIEDVIIPAIRSSGLSSGLLTGVSSIAKQIDPNFFPETSFYQKGGSATKGPGSIFSFVAMIILILIFRFLGFFSRGRRGRSRFRGGFGGSSGGFRGGFGGGGFGGGGGGFSGGGASGRW